MTIRRKLADADPRSVTARRDLSIAHAKLGDAYQKLDDFKAAFVERQEALRIDQKLADADRSSAVAQRDLELSHVKFGDVQWALEDLKAARESYQAGVAIAEKLADADRANVTIQRDQWLALSRVADTDEAEFRFPEARQIREKELAVLQRLDQSGRLRDRGLLKQIEESIAFCKMVEQAVADLDFALKQPAELVPKLLSARCGALARQGFPAEAAVTADKLAQFDPKNPAYLYKATIGFALCSTAVPEKEMRERYADRAIELLHQAVAAGFKNVKLLKGERDLSVLRGRADFQQLIAELEKK